MLKKYNANYIPGVFGLHNPGVLCYLNSLTQCLMSCSSFNEYLVKNKFNNTLIEEYVKIYKENAINGDVPKTINISQTQGLLTALIKARVNSIYNLGYGRQEDLQEGLILLLDSMGNKTDKLFHVRYGCKIKCFGCKKETYPGNSKDYTEPPEIMIDLSENDPFTGKKLDTKEAIQEYILNNIQIPAGYKCECGEINSIENGKQKVRIAQIYSLKRLSEIIVIIFKKYKQKEQRFFPQELEFPSNEGKLIYKAVAQAEHYGGMHGGHYMAKCVRNQPGGFLEQKQDTIQDKLSETELSLNLLNMQIRKDEIESAKIASLVDLKQQLTDELILLKEKNEEKLQVFSCNDSGVQLDKSGLKPTMNTYIVFYHLFSNSK